MADTYGSLVVLGAGGHARVVAEAAELGRVVGHLSPSDEGAGPILGPRLGDDAAASELHAAGHAIAVGVGFVDRPGAAQRAQIIDRLGSVALATVIHPTAVIAPSARIDAGVFVAAGAVVGTNTTVGIASIVNTGAIVDHDCRIGANVHLGTGTALSGGVEVGDSTLIGVGASVRQGIRIGADVVIGAGAVVVTDIADGETAMGVPARARRDERGH